MRLAAIDAAKCFVKEFHPGCQFALLAGSAAKGLATESSDLDIVVFYEDRPCTRESYERYGWKIESFIQNHTSYKEFFARERQSGKPVLANMMKDGLVLKDSPAITAVKQHAIEYLLQGPEPLTPEFIEASRYFIFDLVDDFVDAKNEEEALLTINTLSTQVAEFFLRYNQQWIGRGKGLARALTAYDEAMSTRYFNALRAFYKGNDKQPFVDLVHEIYQPLGGPVFDGFKR